MDLLKTNQNQAESILNALQSHFGMDAFQINQSPPFRAVILGILSQRTREENSSKAVTRLFNIADTPENILALDMDELKSLIRVSGYYNQKARYIKGACKLILEEYQGKVPTTREELQRLPGVGPKTADIVLSYGFGLPSIAVDTHILRVARRLGLVGKKQSPEVVKQSLETLFRREDWGYIDGSLLQIGKKYCAPRRPKCGLCILRDFCEFVRG